MPADFRYRRLGYVALNVTDVERTKAFYADIVGLQAAGSAGDEHLFRCTDAHHDVVIQQSAEPGLRRIAWEMASSDDLVKIENHLSNLGLKVHIVSRQECEALGIERAIRTTQPHTGACFEFFHHMRAATQQFEPTVAKIVRLGHVVIATQDHQACEKFLLDEFNFRASDRIEGAVTFMRCFPNPLHHSLGLSNGKRNHLHHVNFMVTDLDDIGTAFYRLQKNNVPIVYGPGRHPPSGSVFLYYLDPDGMTLEFSYGMEEFPEVEPREPRLLPKSLQSFDYWGAVPTPEFAAKGEIEPLVAV